MTAMPLTDTVCRHSYPKEKPFRLFDGGGPYLEVSPGGSKWWRLKYRFDGKGKRLSFGVYPDVTLKDAREKRDQARKLLAADTDPSENRKAVQAARVERLGNSFEVIGRERFAKFSPTLSEGHRNRILRGLEKDVFPWIGGRPITDITASQLLPVLRQRADCLGVSGWNGQCVVAGNLLQWVARRRGKRLPTLTFKFLTIVPN